jgi:hypothetical protein
MKMNPLALKALDVACEELGRGEEGRNNDGPDVLLYTGGKRGNWCAAFLCWCFEEAAERMGWHGLVPKRSHGAKRFTKNVALHGYFVNLTTDHPRPGDIISWNRGTGITWRGHVGIVYAYLANTDTLLTIEANSGKFPAKVKIKLYANGSWRKRLYRISRMETR